MADVAKPKKDKKLKRMIELNPSIEEGVDASRLDQLLREGLVTTDQLQLARKALANPKQAVNNNQMRPLVAEVLSTLLDMVTHDTTLFQKVRVDLQQRHKLHEGDMSAMVQANAKSTAKDMVKRVLGNHLGLLGQHIADQAMKTDKSKRK